MYVSVYKVESRSTYQVAQIQETANKELLKKPNEWKAHCEASEMKRVELQSKLAEAEKKISLLETSSVTPEALQIAENEAKQSLSLVEEQNERIALAEKEINELKETNQKLDDKVKELTAAAAAAAVTSAAAVGAAAAAENATVSEGTGSDVLCGHLSLCFPLL